MVNNAGIVRDRMFVSCGEDEWDAVVRVHLKGHFAVSRFAAEHWRAQAKGGEAVDARIVNTSSGAGVSVRSPRSTSIATSSSGDREISEYVPGRSITLIHRPSASLHFPVFFSTVTPG